MLEGTTKRITKRVSLLKSGTYYYLLTYNASYARVKVIARTGGTIRVLYRTYRGRRCVGHVETVRIKNILIARAFIE